MNKRKVFVILWKILFLQLPFILLLAIPAVAIWSWVSSLYIDDTVRSLLNSDGIRWSVGNILTNLDYVPLATICSMLMCAGVLCESGLVRTIFTIIVELNWQNGSVSLKQKRALMLTIGFVEFIAALFILQYFFRGSLLLSAFGTYEESSLSRGWLGLLIIFFIVIGNMFGYASGKFVSIVDFINAHTYFIRKCSGYFITAFLSAELIACIKYTGLLGDDAITVLSYILFYVPLLSYFISSILSSRIYQMKPFTFL